MTFEEAVEDFKNSDWQLWVADKETIIESLPTSNPKLISHNLNNFTYKYEEIKLLRQTFTPERIADSHNWTESDFFDFALCVELTS